MVTLRGMEYFTIGEVARIYGVDRLWLTAYLSRTKHPATQRGFPALMSRKEMEVLTLRDPKTRRIITFADVKNRVADAVIIRKTRRRNNSKDSRA